MAEEKAGVKKSGGKEEELFLAIEAALRADGTEGGFARLFADLEKARKYQELFDALIVHSRHRLGLPLIQVGPATNIPDDLVTPHEDDIAEACKKVGGLFLRDGDLAKAWPYLRAVGEHDKMSEAIANIEPGTRRKDLDGIIEIAVNEGILPNQGLDMIVHHYGICNAITNFEQFQPTFSEKNRQKCAAVLLHALYDELLDNIKAEVERQGQDAKVADDEGIHDLIKRVPELFSGNAYYIDTSHLWSIIRFCTFITDPAEVELGIELTEYGKCLSDLYKYDSEAPFEDYFNDYAVLLSGILAHLTGKSEEVAAPAEHFLRKGRDANALANPDYPMRSVVDALVRMGCATEAMELALEWEEIEGTGRLMQPSIYELCQLAGDYDRLMEVARKRGDPVSFTAGLFQKSAEET